MAFLPFLNKNLGECACSLDCSDDPNFSCIVTFQYINTNAIQDDSFDFFIIKPNGLQRFIGNINPVCSSYRPSPLFPGCLCEKVDTFQFTATITASDITITEAPPGPSPENPCGTIFNSCTIQWRSELVADNGCGTAGSFSIFGDCGFTLSGGDINGSGTIDLSEICCSLENSP